MSSAPAYLHGGPLDGTVQPAQVGPDGQPPERMEFDHTAEGGRWYVEYRRLRREDNGWHFEATGNQQRADEE